VARRFRRTTAQATPTNGEREGEREREESIRSGLPGSPGPSGSGASRLPGYGIRRVWPTTIRSGFRSLARLASKILGQSFVVP